MVWVYVAKRRQWLDKKCSMEYEVEGAVPGGRPERTCKKTVRYVNRTGRMLWIIVDGGI